MRQKVFNNPFSLITSLLIVIVVATTLYSNNIFDKKTIRSDVKGYYAYLPGLFINDDLAFKDLSKYIDENKESQIWVLPTEDGKNYIKYTCGLAIVYSPFFFVADSLAEPLGYTADGYSKPYQNAIVFASFFFFLFGLYFSRKLLLLFFDDTIAAIVLPIIFIGTNLIYYFGLELGLSHGYSFSLIVFFVYGCAIWLKNPSYKWAILIGLSAGVFILIRPTDIFYLLLIPLLFVTSVDSFKQRITLLFSKKWMILTMMVVAFVAFLPQLFYFHFIFGQYLYFSYTGESFFFLQPHLLDVAFSYRNGWLIYSPLMLLAILGFFLYKKNKKYRWAVLVIFVLNFYAISSWWCWWYIGFGNRAMINLYPILLFPLAEMINYLYKKNWLLRVILVFTVFWFSKLSYRQANFYRMGIIHYDSMTSAAYWSVFNTDQVPQTYQLKLEHPVYDQAVVGNYVNTVAVLDTIRCSSIDFEAAKKRGFKMGKLSTKKSFQGKKSLYIHKSEYFFDRKIAVDSINRIFISAKVTNPEGIVFILEGSDSIPYYHASWDFEKISDDWYTVQLFSTIPDDFQLDSLSFAIWNKDMNAFYFDDFSVQGYRLTTKEIKH